MMTTVLDLPLAGDQSGQGTGRRSQAQMVHGGV